MRATPELVMPSFSFYIRSALRAPRSTILCVVGVVGGLGLAAFVRGSWADSAPLMPASVQSGPVCHLYEMPREGKQVRCAMLLPYSLDQVWAAVTDYDNYGDICPYVHAAEVTHDPNGTCHIDGAAESSLSGDIHFAADVRHEQLLDRYSTTWDQPSGNVLVNRGHWILTPKGRSETLLELTLEVQMRNIPTFILRNISMHRLPEVVRAVEHRLRTKAAGKKW
jgi:ribosome-associated toxin RatA of RatAB toxin-antitoxin module